MIESIVRLKNLCEILIAMGFNQSSNEAEIKHLIVTLETLIIKEMELLKEQESVSGN